jgi:predicted DNA-binding protein (MmcQ/YjbR family)
MPSPLELIRAEAEKYPEAEKAFLFGDHEVYRVKKKVFVWLGDGETPGSTYVSVKLKDTQGMALTLPFVTPSEYGMAKWGWVSADFPKGKFAEPLVREWIRESYQHTAPKKLVALLEGGAPAEPAKKKAARRKTTARNRPRRSA